MQNSGSVNFPSWVTNSNASNTSSKWQEYQIADFLLKNQNLKNQNIYPPTISQLAAHSDYLEKMSNLAAVNSNDMQLNNLNNLNNLNSNVQSHLSDLNGLNDLNSGHLMLSNTANGLQSNHHSLNKNLSNGLMDGSQVNSFSNHNGNSSASNSSGSGRKCLNKGNFLCGICNKSFTQKGNLKTHQLIHTGTKPFLCNVCGKGFTQKGNVDTHMKIHTGQKKAKKVKQKDLANKDRRDDLKFNNQESLLNANQNQSVIDRLLPMQLNNSPINFSSHHNSTSTGSTSNWNSLTNNLINNSGIKSNRSSSSGNNFQSANAYDEFANLANYNTFTQQMNSINNSNHQNLHHKLLEQFEQLNQNGKNSPIQNLTMQQQIDLGHLNYNGNDFSLLQ